jgi:hypothetical protein
VGGVKFPGGEEPDSVFVSTRGNHFRALATPVEGVTVCYAVSLRMREPIEGYATIATAADTGSQFSDLGFSSGCGGTTSLWTNAPGGLKTDLKCTTLRMLLVRYVLNLRRLGPGDLMSRWASASVPRRANAAKTWANKLNPREHCQICSR